MEEILITGIGGEIGHGLVEALGTRSSASIVGMDVRPIAPEIRAKCSAFYECSVTDRTNLGKVFEKHSFSAIYHLAALLSTAGERDPERSHHVNVEGTFNLIRDGHAAARSSRKPVVFVFPSTIAVYGLPADHTAAVKEDEGLSPVTMYGINKLYAEQLGVYYACHQGRLDGTGTEGLLDFRSVRLPGVVSAFTLPSGGTSDYFPEMVHAAARGEPYACFVPESARIPFMVMPDAVKALTSIAAAPAGAFTERRIFNVGAFAPSAGEIRSLVAERFPGARITFEPHAQRTRIVESWPDAVDDGAARKAWGWRPEFDLRAAFERYLEPNIKARYAGKAA